MRNTSRPITRALAYWLAALAVSGAALADCSVQSGPSTAALVELYTSQGCSSCPPADQQLNRLGNSTDRRLVVVPIALHVDYWDYIGWRDAFARPEFSVRQKRLAQGGRGSVYTPQFFVNGTEWRPWHDSLPKQLQAINQIPAAAQIALRGRLNAARTMTIDADVSTIDRQEPSSLYLAVAESGLATNVLRGENAGSKLAHDHVVREWLGPLLLNNGQVAIQQKIELSPLWDRSRLEVLAFVQSNRTGKVLQAVSASHCAIP